ncbi:hypothetical protein OsI_16500 [Oryza sativa Indica Group]|uniref:DUF4220 domain-containing protein n=1 Tax=Oryza sativa subsp. indica TaxID=39946 RepID=A2XV63_ORYSI|nr:hypothetical protein OsI_16500 [Oryza sativa Indica Group]
MAASGLLHLWNEWGIQILVLASFALQVFLLVFGGIRRRSSSAVLRVALWLAYLLADSTAIYTLGHLSVASQPSSSPPRHHQLVAFWAPFLLLHLGGPDNITAYALEDNSLWLRHLQTLAVQVLGAAYVLYKHVAGGFLLLASVSMFTAGLVKYGREGVGAQVRQHEQYPRQAGRVGPHGQALQAVFLDITLEPGTIEPGCTVRVDPGEDMYKLLEMELSLMYDILYTKAAVIHTWHGLCVHLTSLLGTAAAFVLFQLSITISARNGGTSGFSAVDVAISYVLLAGALVLEAMSLCRALLSSWTCSLVHEKARSSSFYSGTPPAWLRWLRRALVGLRRPARSARRRLWRGSIGQYNLFHLCTRDRGELGSRMATKVGLQDWWNRLHCTGSFSDSGAGAGAGLSMRDMKELVSRALPLADVGARTNLNSRGRMILERMGARGGGDDDYFAQWSMGIDFDESVLVWHIATDVYIRESMARRRRHGGGEPSKLAEATMVLSNYMMFLLVAKPDMLPGRARHNLYLDICKSWEGLWRDCMTDEGNPVEMSPRSWNPYRGLKELFHREGPNCSRIPQREKLAEKLFISYKDIQAFVQQGAARDPLLEPFRDSGDKCAVLLAKELLDLGRDEDEMLELIFGVWVEMMLYAADHCARDSHARQLSNGGEFITIVWLLVHHRMYIARYNKFINMLNGRHPGSNNPNV